MCDPSAHADYGARRQIFAADGRAACRCHPLERQAERRVYTSGFLDTGVQVGQGNALLPGCGYRELAGGGGDFELVTQAEQSGRVPKQTVE
jgi:hypothetical protein